MTRGMGAGQALGAQGAGGARAGRAGGRRQAMRWALACGTGRRAAGERTRGARGRGARSALQEWQAARRRARQAL